MPESVPFAHVLCLAGGLFVLGLLGVLARRNALFVLLSVEIMLNGAALAFVGAGSLHGQAAGQAMFVFILAVAACELAVGLALVFLLEKKHRSLDSDKAHELGE